MPVKLITKLYDTVWIVCKNFKPCFRGSVTDDVAVAHRWLDFGDSVKCLLSQRNVACAYMAFRLGFVGVYLKRADTRLTFPYHHGFGVQRHRLVVEIAQEASPSIQ